jgi:hypothetical protein
MGKFNTLAAFAAAAIAMGAIATPAQAAFDNAGAEKVRKLDIMLMVTALRCRHGADGFQADYNAFSANNLTQLNAASRKLEADLAQRHGRKGAKRALDKISVGMANKYGNGHPWMGCKDLKRVAKNLSSSRDEGALLAAADELLSDRATVALAAGQ